MTVLRSVLPLAHEAERSLTNELVRLKLNAERHFVGAESLHTFSKEESAFGALADATVSTSVSNQFLRHPSGTDGIVDDTNGKTLLDKLCRAQR